jgi:signal transduction histidine kinase
MSGSSAILRALGDGLIVLDLDGVVRQINPVAAQLLAVDPVAALDLPLGRLPGGSALEQLADLQPGLVELGDHALSAERRPLLADDQHEVLGALLVLRDLSGELAERRRQYDFFCRALHDVRVPLQAISGSAEGLMRGWFGPLNDDQREFAGVIKENADHQGVLFSQLHDAYALSTRFIKLDAEHISVDSVFHALEQELAPRFAARDQRFEIELAPDLPPIVADRQRLRQLMLALLDNAARYTHPGGVVTLRARQLGDAVQIDVQDTGVGIRLADQPSLFTPFFRGENPLKEGRYGGLSLVIAKQLAELHGGQLWFESREGHGSTFSLSLPLAP